MRASRHLALTLALLATACGSSKQETRQPAPDNTPGTVARPPEQDIVASCVHVRQQLLACPEEGVALYMHAWAKADPSYAAKVQDPAEHAAARARGLKEMETLAGSKESMKTLEEECAWMSRKVPERVPETFPGLLQAVPGCDGKACADRAECLRPYVEMAMGTVSVR